MTTIYEQLKTALAAEIQAHHLSGRPITVRCKALSAREAIGNPDQTDYPIIKGREVMVEAEFLGSRGQAFTDAHEDAAMRVEELPELDLRDNRRRAVFVSGLNAVFRHLGLCGKTIHCKDNEPCTCAETLPEVIGGRGKVLMVGHQPRFLEKLAALCAVRTVDLDADNIGKDFSGIRIEPPENTKDAISWCDMVFATGSTLVNGTISQFLELDKPVVFYGVTIAAAGKILGLNTYCRCGH